MRQVRVSELSRQESEGVVVVEQLGSHKSGKRTALVRWSESGQSEAVEVVSG